MKRLAKLSGTEAVRAERALHIGFAEPDRLPHALIRLEHVDAGYALKPLAHRERDWGEGSDDRGTAISSGASSGAARHHGAPGHEGQLLPEGEGSSTVILQDVRFGLEAGDRIGLLGPNGAGKSTLVKTLVGELPLLAGERLSHPDLKLGYFAQHTVEALHAGQTPMDHLRAIAPNESAQAFRDFLGRWNFPGDRAFESVDGFSGGERARLALALIAWRKPNVLLLDEPTNHLDLDMREALAEALSDFPGAIVLVSHDRHLVGLVCDSFWRVANGRVEPFEGDLDEYAAWLRSRPAAETRDTAAAAAPSKPATRKPARANPQRMAKAEARLADLQSRLDAFTAELADPAIYADGGARATEIARRQSALREELERTESELLELYAADAA
jgi:ATP-binding cassette subfamily F protein 3